MIRLKGELDWELTRLGLKSGDVIKNHTKPSATNGEVFFDVYYNGTTQGCVVWEDNYDLIKSETDK